MVKEENTGNRSEDVSENQEEPEELSPKTKAFAPTLEKDYKLKFDRILGSGSYSRVARATFGDKKIEVAAKVINITPTREKDDYIKKFLPREKEIVKLLKHDNICRLYEMISFPDHIIFVTEFCAGGDLLRKMKDIKTMNEDEAKFMFRQFIAALTHLQAYNIVHRDLKCENIFLDKYENVKLGDFGFSRILKPGEKSATFCGSRAYVAPEILRGREYSGNAVDVWSTGVILYIMLTGSMPFDDRNPQKMIERQLAHKIKFPKSCTASTSSKALILEILQPHAPNRPTYKAICESEWLRNQPYYMKPDEPPKPSTPAAPVTPSTTPVTTGNAKPKDSKRQHG
ncbi:hypothetical protein CRE_23940 [Caenorhabditis remanei]|uniref:Protein kinase domain-containing protein n=1 Tax=Caenorhabditis remanei TaxID=31234 RepID=E3MGJ9_CAERE|nr:hypothetical protein CRE_23940 [Caenorhabditis remanei]